MKKLFVKTYGCQMNAYDSARMADLLAPLGYAAADGARGRRHGDPQHLPHPRKGGREGLFRTGPAQDPEGAKRPRTAAACCWRWPAASPRPRARRSWRAQPAVDLVVGPQSYHRLPEMIARHARAAGQVLETDFPALEKFDSLPAPAAQPASAPFSPCRKAATSSAPSAWCPIPAAPNIRARPKRFCARRASWWKGRARDRAAGPERQCL